ncbi:hypothetical protein LZZ85_28050 [Terrimonas sp. NA20]|uniref:Uncharacterized protein n=1 Tax=Terrimonas ginsenosidimutans TaxID=2908004 RepID=A0ABS9L0P9_9BACT|nr:hypothetical protein [Terrimonas ginsenosidimutans]MCG2618186.1 hypothetical protein [Terrimonas ginsenosidimutans]
MIRLLVAVSLVFSLASCMKGSVGNGDGQSYRAIETDTIRTGQFWGINVGDPAQEVYTKVQTLRTEKQIAYLGIAANTYNDLSAIQTRIPFYNSIFLDEATATSTGIQIGFKAEKVDAIFLNNGAPLTKWPGINDFQHSISIGDSVSTIYEKLVAIKGVSVYGQKLQRLSLFDKNISKDFEPSMSTVAKWQILTTVTSNKRWQLVELNFSAGTLASVYYTLFENY